jgi:hypothetical protein
LLLRLRHVVLRELLLRLGGTLGSSLLRLRPSLLLWLLRRHLLLLLDRSACLWCRYLLLRLLRKLRRRWRMLRLLHLDVTLAHICLCLLL